MIKKISYSVLAGVFGLAIAFWSLVGLRWSYQLITARSLSLTYLALPSRLITPSIPILINLLFVGDIMLDRGVRQKVEKFGGGDYHWLFQNLPELRDYDLVFGNLEGPVSNRGTNHGSRYSFRMATTAPGVLRDAGFQVLSVANNHAGDWGREAFLDTLKWLGLVGLTPVGGAASASEAIKPQVLERGGLMFGFLGFSDVGPKWFLARDSPATPGILLADDNLPAIIKTAASDVDVLIVSFHFGEEYQVKPSTRQRSLANAAIAAGARLIIGHHPHVVQPVERQGDAIIAYSLGNFIFDQSFSTGTMSGLALAVTLDDQGKIVSYREWPTKLNVDYQPVLISQ